MAEKILTAFQELNKKEILEKAKGARHFVISVDKTHKDEIELKNGMKLWTDPKFNEVANRVHSGYVVCAPKKLENVIKKGARIWFHHMVTNIQRPQKIEEGIYYLGWTQTLQGCVDNQVFAYQNKGEDIVPFQWWMFVKPFKSTRKLESKILDLSFSNEKAVNDVGEIALIGEKPQQYYGLKKGDVICYNITQRYMVEIDGEIYFRVNPESAFYVEEARS